MIIQNSLYNCRWRIGDCYPNIVAYYFKTWKNYQMLPHVHDQAEIMYVLSGSCKVEVLGISKILQKGDFVLLDAGTSHGLEVSLDRGCRMLNIEFQFVDTRATVPSVREMTEEIPMFAAFLEASRPYLIARDYYEVYPTMKSIISELDEKKRGHQMLTNLYMSELLMKLSRAYEDQLGQQSTQGSFHVHKALTYIHQNYDQEFRIKDLAVKLCIHEGYLHRIFKEYTDLTPIAYLTRLRLNKAKMLLRRTEIPVSQISDYVGINSSQYFTALFKKHLGISPSEYRGTVDRWANSQCSATYENLLDDYTSPVIRPQRK